MQDSDLAASRGLKTGDVIIALNGKPVSDHIAAVEIINGCAGKLALTYYPAAAAEVERKRTRAKYGGRDVAPLLVVSAVAFIVLLAVLYFAFSSSPSPPTDTFGMSSVLNGQWLEHMDPTTKAKMKEKFGDLDMTPDGINRRMAAALNPLSAAGAGVF